MLWTDIIDPAELTGYVRAWLEDYEARNGTLARWLPNRLVPDINVRFVAGSTGLVPIAQFRAYDAEPAVGSGPKGKRVTLELPALGLQIPVSEYTQLRNRNASDDTIRTSILDTARANARAVVDSIERARGIVLSTGKFTVNPTNFGGSAEGFYADDDYGRAAGHTAVVSNSWAGTTVDILGDLQTAFDAYVDINGEEPGVFLTSTRVVRAMAKNDQFKTALAAGGNRPATQQQINDTVQGASLPEIITYNRRVSVGGTTTKVIPDDRILLLPAPVETEDWEGTQLGATFYGQTLSSQEPDWGIAEEEQPGIVLGVYREPKPPMVADVVSDAIAQPVLANANLSYSLDVL